MIANATAALELVSALVSAIELTPGVAVHAVDRAGRVTYWNERCAQLYGVAAEEALGQPLISLVSHPGHDAEFAAETEGIWDSGTAPLTRDWPVCLRDGTVRWASTTTFPLIRNGRVEQIFRMEIDITGRKSSERHLMLAGQVFDNCRDAILITGTDYRIIAVNRAFTAITGFSPLDVVGREAPRYDGQAQDEAIYAQIREHVRADGHWSGELLAQRKNGQVFPLEAAVTALRDPEGQLTGYMSILTDITERKRLEQETRHLAEHDFLTGLPNRVLFQDRLQQALATARRKRSQVAVLFLDLDHFKSVNDNHGHDIGDALLREVAGRLVHCVRSVDTVSRQGGDEFVIMLADIGGAEHAAHVAATIMHAVTGIAEAGGTPVAPSASIGISLFPTDGADLDTLFKHADVAMYHAKQSGRNGYCFFSPEMNAHVNERIELQNALRNALARGEFELEFQPEVEIATGQTTTVEALLRWRHPARGLLLPAQFLQVAEESGLMRPIGEWVLRRACAQGQQWRLSGFPVTVAVNLSPGQFLSPAFLASVDAALDSSGLPPHLLDLEVTEAVLMKDSETAIGTIDALRGRGVHVTIDDFGTGYSSLGTLQRMAMSKVKIDRSFVHDIGRDGATVIPAIIALAHSLNLRVVAEGVESAGQLSYLRQHGCDEFQGRLADALVAQGTGWAAMVQ
ncbi:bifunctional diguanylate cyclase/phosphodiesterase [Massilia arenosa]|uniref:Bifunctional diguanylate cyclase/phosphodiesterase n=1 Tax=Zemynaea arenosa TaxID=2561931 RepID=A0A4Y9SNR0_9BURK|nr:bifunctional diguanylate cyclase/phosphodiesterase [Massilia arenosa]TFW26589.1 bifunctional diguanylate cyclase/phosphodiesterase [Massilia arenosa]